MPSLDFEEEKEKAKSSEPSSTDELNVFSFLAIVDDLFPGYDFHSYKADGFVSEILSYGDITPSQFKSIIDNNFARVEKYKESIGETPTRKHAFNPYTELRHVLFQSDQEKYQRALYDYQRNKYLTWAEENPEE